MIKNYNIDIDKSSATSGYTPSLTAKKLPFYIERYGHFYANSDYYTERRDI